MTVFSQIDPYSSRCIHQKTALSRRQHGFESRTGCHLSFVESSCSYKFKTYLYCLNINKINRLRLINFCMDLRNIFLNIEQKINFDSILSFDTKIDTFQ